MGVSSASAAIDTLLNYVSWQVVVAPEVEPMATKNPTFTFDVVQVPVSAPIDQDTVRQLIRRDAVPTLQQSAVLFLNDGSLKMTAEGDGSGLLQLLGLGFRVFALLGFRTSGFGL